jgi:hypothetical protein
VRQPQFQVQQLLARIDRPAGIERSANTQQETRILKTSSCIEAAPKDPANLPRFLMVNGEPPPGR